MPEALALLNQTLGGPGRRPDLDIAAQVSVRLQAMVFNPEGVRHLAAEI